MEGDAGCSEKNSCILTGDRGFWFSPIFVLEKLRSSTQFKSLYSFKFLSHLLYFTTSRRTNKCDYLPFPTLHRDWLTAWEPPYFVSCLKTAFKKTPIPRLMDYNLKWRRMNKMTGYNSFWSNPKIHKSF